MLESIKSKKPVYYQNEKLTNNLSTYLDSLSITFLDIVKAENRMIRWSGIIKYLFPETEDGIIESPLLKANNLQKLLYPNMVGNLYLKLDSHLLVAGSIKARGGIYEVIVVAEKILKEHEILIDENNIENIRLCLSDYTMSVASTGNLGLSIGIMSVALGFKAIVHMSNDAKEWKKKRLIDKGVKVIEYNGDFTYAAKMGREQALLDSKNHFIDDENSKELFLGYSVSALRIKKQFNELGIKPSKEKPLYLYLPCGVGGAPGGITFGFKHVFGQAVKCYFAEPVNCPSMLLGVLTGKLGDVNVSDFGIVNQTSLDGLAVASPSNFVAPLMEKLCDGFYTVEDDDMFIKLKQLKDSEKITIEPSAAAGINGVSITNNLNSDGYHIIWTTGGLFVPDEIYDRMYAKGALLCQKK